MVLAKRASFQRGRAGLPAGIAPRQYVAADARPEPAQYNVDGARRSRSLLRCPAGGRGSAGTGEGWSSSRAFHPRRFVGLVLDPVKEHVLAVRFSNAADSYLDSRFQGFAAGLRRVEPNSVHVITVVRQVSAAVAFFVGVFAAFTVLYLLLRAFRRKSWENLFFAFFTGFVASNLCVELPFVFTEDAARALWHFWFLAVTCVGIVLSGLALEHVVFRRRPSWWTWLIGAAGIGLLVWLLIWTSLRAIVVFRVYLLLGSAEMLRVAVAAVRRRERDAWIVVAVAKSLFQTSREEPGPAAVLRRVAE